MRRHIAIVLASALLVIVASVVFDGVTTEESPHLIQFDPELSPDGETARPDDMQTLIDRVSQAAIAGQWASALAYHDTLEKRWHNLQPTSGPQLRVVQDVTNHIEALRYNLLGRDNQGVLNTCRQLTALLAAVPAD